MEVIEVERKTWNIKSFYDTQPFQTKFGNKLEQDTKTSPFSPWKKYSKEKKTLNQVGEQKMGVLKELEKTTYHHFQLRRISTIEKLQIIGYSFLFMLLLFC